MIIKYNLMLETFQHNAAFRKRDSEVYQQFKRFLFYENRSVRPVYFSYFSSCDLTVTTQRLKSFAVTS